MADEEKKPAGSKQVLRTWKEWVSELGIKAHHAAGAAVYAAWKDDQTISRAEFEAKLNEWKNRPVGRRL